MNCSYRLANTQFRIVHFTSVPTNRQSLSRIQNSTVPFSSRFKGKLREKENTGLVESYSFVSLESEML
jgi:hypothetical protein